MPPNNFTDPGLIESAALIVYRGAVAVNDVLEGVRSEMVWLLVVLTGAVVAGLLATAWRTRKNRPAPSDPNERADMALLNQVAHDRAKLYMDRFVQFGVNHDAFFQKDAKVPAALASATNRFALRSSDGGDDDDDDDGANGKSLASLMKRIQQRDNDGSEQPLGLLIVADDGAVQEQAPGYEAASKVLQAHPAAKKLSSALETAGFATCLMSNLGDLQPNQRTVGSVLKQMQISKRRFRGSLLYICGRVRLVPLPMWPSADALKSEKGRAARSERLRTIGNDADAIFEVLVEPNAPDAPTSWIDLPVLICRLASCADTAPHRPVVILNVAWDSAEDKARALKLRSTRTIFGADDDPEGLLSALHGACPVGALASVSVIAAQRVTSDATKGDAKKSADVVCNALSEGIRAATATVSKSAALGLAAGPSQRTLATESPYHCGAMTAASIAEFLTRRRTHRTGSTEALLMPPVGASINCVTPFPLAVQPVAGPRGVALLPVTAAPNEGGAKLDEAVLLATRGVNDRAYSVVQLHAPQDQLQASWALLNLAWNTTLLSTVEDQVYYIDVHSIADVFLDPATTSPDAMWSSVLFHLVELLIGSCRRPGTQEEIEALFLTSFANSKAVFCVDLRGWDRVPDVAAAFLGKHFCNTTGTTTESEPCLHPVFVFAISERPLSAPFAREVSLPRLTVGDMREFIGPTSAAAITSTVPEDHALWRLVRGPLPEAVLSRGPFSTSRDVVTAIVDSLPLFGDATMRCVLFAEALLAPYTTAVPVNAFATWLASGLVSEFRDAVLARAANDEETKDAATLGFRQASAVQSVVAALVQRQLLLLGTDQEVLTIRLNPAVKAAAAWTVPAGVTGPNAAAALLYKWLAVGLLGRHGKAPGPQWLQVVQNDGFIVPHLIRVLPCQPAKAPSTAEDTNQVAEEGTTSNVGKKKVINDDPWVLSDVLSSLIFLNACGAAPLVAALRLRRAASAAASETDAFVKIDAATGEQISALMRTATEAADVLHSNPAEFAFQLTSRLTTKDRANPAVAALVQQARNRPLWYAYRGDDDCNDTIAPQSLQCLITSVQPEDAMVGPRLCTTAGGDNWAASKGDLPPHAVTAANLVRLATGGMHMLVIGRADGSIAYCESAALEGRYAVSVDSKESAAATALRLPLCSTGEAPWTLVARSPHKAPVAAIFTQRFADGVKLVTASKQDRCIAVWASFDMNEGGEPQIMQMLPPPVPEPASAKADGGTDGEDPANEEALPHDRRGYYTSSVCSAHLDIPDLLRDRLPDRFDGFTDHRLDLDREQAKRKAAASGIKRGDAVLLHAVDDNLNSTTYHGERAQPYVSSFTFLYGSPKPAEGAITATTLVELPVAGHTRNADEGRMLPFRGFTGLLVGEASGHVSLFAVTD
jgi:hypothetical protein